LEEKWIFDELAKPVRARKIPMEEFLRKEALGLLDEWQMKQDHLHY
jgi:hypothetical protein